MNILVGILTFVLILVSVFLILIVLAQKAKSDGGMGSAIGGGMAEAAFGADTGNVLSKATINSAIVFFVLALVLYMGRIYQRTHVTASGGALPAIPISMPPMPVTTAPGTTPPGTTAVMLPSAAPAAAATATPMATPLATPTPVAAEPAKQP
jgi:preprotein translocase subunit SecG